MKNRHPGNCETCRTRVAAEQGELRKIAGRWIVLCSAHSSSVAAATAQAVLALVVRIWFAAGRVLCAPVSRLNSEFSSYLTATRAVGAGFSKQHNAQICNLEQAPALIEALQAAGFTCDVDPEVIATLQARAAQATVDIDSAQGRAAEVDAMLRQTGRALFPFQSIGVEWMAPRRKLILGDDMGLGKTIQALVAAPRNAKLLVICPAVAKGVWTRESRRFRPDLTPVALSGRGSFRWPTQPGEMIIVNYDILPHVEEPATIKKSKVKVPNRATWEHKLRAPLHYGETSWSRIGTAMEIEAAWHKAFTTAWEKIGQRYHGTLVLAACPADVIIIADEAHALKSSKAARTNRFRALSKVVLSKNGRGWLLTATPLLNRGAELWSMLQAVHAANEVYGSYKRYLSLWNAYESRFGIVWGTPTPEVAEGLRTFMMRRLKTEVLTQLPPKTIRTIEVNGLSESLKKLCDAVLAEGVDLDKLATATEDSANKRPAFRSFSAVRAQLAMVKLGAAMEMVEDFEDAEEPLVVFSAHRNPILTLGARAGWACITGDTSAEKRTQIEDEFQAGKLKGVACTIKAGGVAITLTRASNALFIDEELTPALNSQGQDRVYRIGQSRGVVITRLVAAHALDRRIAELLDAKTAIIEVAINGARRGADETVDYTAPTVDTTTLTANTAAIAQAKTTVAAEDAALTATLTAAVAVAKSDPGIEITVTNECPF